MRREALRELLDPATGLYPELAARLMTRLGIDNITNLLEHYTAPSTNMIYLNTNQVQGLNIDNKPTGPVIPPRR